MIRYFLLWVMMLILGWAMIAAAEDDLIGSESMGDSTAETANQDAAASGEEAPDNTPAVRVDNQCNKACMDKGGYSFVCNNMCATGNSANPKKFSEEQYGCYSECTANRKNGALFCMQKCNEYAKYKLKEDKLPVEKQGINIQSSPIHPQ
ncbi:MAG: hypothetical protein EB060_07030 [Proteobacteria bacterium]|nr:hypothetical protein [Pseudomonadota bacterium]